MHQAEAVSIRRAGASDVRRVIDIIRAGVPDAVKPYTIYCSDGLERFYRETFENQEVGRGLYLVAELAGEIVAFADYRVRPGVLIGTSLYVAPEARGGNIGTRMFLAVFRYGLEWGAETVVWEVFAALERQRAWYATFGMEVVGQLEWVTIPPLRDGDNGQWWSLPDMPHANAAHAAFGFSQFTLETRDATYRVGRIGRKLFRLDSDSLLADGAARAALSKIDSSRELLLLRPAQDARAIEGMNVIETAYRVRGDLRQVTEALTRRIQR